MRKKYLSALLFGALLFASAGTFTSCKDYDDDINNLQQQITSNKDAIAALQKLVGEGKWVSSVTPIENGFTVTMNDGTTQNITGINGEDGKPGTVITLDPTTNNWVIDGVDTGVCAKGEKGEQGEQGEQGEAGEQGPAGEAGEPGKSPYIDKETGNWFVWEWDEATSEYKAVDSGVYAGSTQIYVVEKDGFIELNVDGTAYLLPTTSDAYTVEAPAATVKITVQTANWKPKTNDRTYQALLKAFPEIGEIEEDALLKQGAELPVLVTPASIDLTDGFKFSLQTLKDGMVEDITLSNPTKGISDEWNISDGKMSRAASEEDCLWTLQVNQELDKNDYATAKNLSLVVENANGKVVKTPFAYTIENKKIQSNEPVQVIFANTETPELASEIDLFAPVTDNDYYIVSSMKEDCAPIEFVNDFEGKYIITLTDQLDVEKYGLSIVDGHKLVIANPGNETSIDVKVKVQVLGLNGQVTEKEGVITVTQSIASIGQLSDKQITLSTKTVSNYSPSTVGQIVKWDIEELGFTTATQLHAFVAGGKKVTLIDKDENEKSYAVQILDAEGNVITNADDYAKADAFRFVLPSADVLPGDYRVVVEATEANNAQAVIYKTEAAMTVDNPKETDLFALASAYTTDGKVLQVVGNVSGNTITYTLADGIVQKTGQTQLTVQTVDHPEYGFIDVDNAEWTGASSWGEENWVNNGILTVLTQGEENKEGKEHLYKERNIRGTYQLFGNPDNLVEYNFKVKVLSPVYSADGSNITVDATKTAAYFDGKTVDLTAAISAKYVAGINKDKALALFDIAEDKKDGTVYNLNYGKQDGYATNASGKPIQIDQDDLIDFGMPLDQFTKITDETFYIMVEEFDEGGYTYKGWNTIMNELFTVYESKDGALALKIGYKADDAAVKAVAKQKAMFDKYASQLVWNDKKPVTIPGSSKANEIHSTKFEFVDADAKKYGTINAAGELTPYTTINDSDLANGKAVVKVKFTVKDNWGMTMTKTFDVTITKK